MGDGLETSHLVTGSVDCLRAAQYEFVCRYYCKTTQIPEKKLRPDEAAALQASGIKIVAAWENGLPTTADYFTLEKGAFDGSEAVKVAATFQQPSTSPIYFCVDYDAVDDDRQAILDYLSGVQTSILGSHPIGVYGSSDVLDWSSAQGVATFYWQAHAPGWSGGRNATPWPQYNLRTVGINKMACGLVVDPCTSPGNHGGW